MRHAFLDKAFEWVQHSSGEGILSAEEYCPTKDVFVARFERVSRELTDEDLFIAVLAEIETMHTTITWEVGPTFPVFILQSTQKKTSLLLQIAGRESNKH